MLAIGTVAASGVLTWRAIDQGVFSTGEGPAYTAWQDAGAEPGNSLSLVRSAILAANNHNTQPWLFRVDETAIDLFADRARNTGTLDPLLREMYISFGAALENIEVASAPNGFAGTITLFPNDQDDLHVANVTLTATTPKTSDRFETIPRRHTNRGAFKKSDVPSDETLASLKALNDDSRLDVVWLTDAASMATFADLTIRATEAINADEEQSKDSFVWFRGSWQDIQSSKDGITVDASGLSPLIRSAAKLLPPSSRSQSDSSWLSSTKDPQLSTAPAFGVIVALDEPGLADYVSAGRLYQRIGLDATALGLALQPLNQLPERFDREASLGVASPLKDEFSTLLPDGVAATLMPFRIGAPEKDGLESPRRPANLVLQEQ